MQARVYQALGPLNPLVPKVGLGTATGLLGLPGEGKWGTEGCPAPGFGMQHEQDGCREGGVGPGIRTQAPGPAWEAGGPGIVVLGARS